MGGCSGLEIGIGVEDRGDFQLWPKRGKFLADNRFAEMVRCWCIRYLKRRTFCILRGAGTGGGTNVSRGHTLRRPQCTVTRTTRRVRGRACDSGGGLWDSRHDISLPTKEAVKRVWSLDVVYDKG